MKSIYQKRMVRGLVFAMLSLLVLLVGCKPKVPVDLPASEEVRIQFIEGEQLVSARVDMPLRSSPEINGAVFSSFEKGQRLVLLAETEDHLWYLVRGADLEGWVFAALTEPVDSDQVVGIPDTSGDPTETVTSTSTPTPSSTPAKETSVIAGRPSRTPTQTRTVTRTQTQTVIQSTSTFTVAPMILQSTQTLTMVPTVPIRKPTASLTIIPIPVISLEPTTSVGTLTAIPISTVTATTSAETAMPPTPIPQLPLPLPTFIFITPALPVFP